MSKEIVEEQTVGQYTLPCNDDVGEFKYIIVVDPYPLNPRREWDNMSKMVCFHKRYDLGDNDHSYSAEDFDSWDELLERIQENENVAAFLPVYMYDHSGLFLSTTSFHCRWDSGQIGWIYFTKEAVKDLAEEYRSQENLEELMQSDVQTYSDYLSGNVYGWEVLSVAECSLGHKHDELLDSCYGYYGDDGLQAAKDEAMHIINRYLKYDAVKEDSQEAVTA